MVGIYTIISPTNKVYVGQSWNIRKRFLDYKTPERCKDQQRIYNSLIKYGVDRHKFGIGIELDKSITQEELNNWEVFIWEYFKSLGFEMLNIKKPGSRGKHSQESKDKMSMAKKGKKRPDLSIRNRVRPTCIGRSGEKHPRARLIINQLTGVFYYGLSEASVSVDMKPNTLQKMLGGKNPNRTALIYI